MDFLGTQQISETVLDQENYDLFLTVAGNSERCTHLIDIHRIKASEKICFAFSEWREKVFRKSRTDSFINAGFEIVTMPAGEVSEIHNILNKSLETLRSKVPKILIDYSCMAKFWYSAIVNYFFEAEHNFDSIELFFAYSPSNYLENKRLQSLKVSKEDSSVINSAANKPKALILSLGARIGRIESLVKLVSPEQLIIMYADPAIDPAYVKKIFSNNHDLINNTESRNIINYPLLEIDQMNHILRSKCMELRIDYNVFIAALGPKVFTLNSLMLMAQYPDIYVLKSSSGLIQNSPETKPSGEVLVQKTTFTNIEED